MTPVFGSWVRNVLWFRVRYIATQVWQVPWSQWICNLSMGPHILDLANKLLTTRSIVNCLALKFYPKINLLPLPISLKTTSTLQKLTKEHKANIHYLVVESCSSTEHTTNKMQTRTIGITKPSFRYEEVKRVRKYCKVMVMKIENGKVRTDNQLWKCPVII